MPDIQVPRRLPLSILLTELARAGWQVPRNHRNPNPLREGSRVPEGEFRGGRGGLLPPLFEGRRYVAHDTSSDPSPPLCLCIALSIVAADTRSFSSSPSPSSHPLFLTLFLCPSHFLSLPLSRPHPLFLSFSLLLLSSPARLLPAAVEWRLPAVPSHKLLKAQLEQLFDLRLRLCMVVYTSFRSSLFLLLFFEPLSIAFETMLAILIHVFHLIEIWHRHSVDNGKDSLGSCGFYKSAAGSLTEWKGLLIRNCGFLLEMVALLMGVGHYMMIWWLHGMAFHLVDAMLFLNLRAILSALVKRMRGFIKLKKALNSLDLALPDATNDELSEFNDECAICRGPMAKAKKLSCNHLFHLTCLRSWLDQGLAEVYSCPTCRRPLFASSSRDQANSLAQQISNDGQISEQVNLEGVHQRISTLSPPAANQQQNSPDPVWRVGLDSSWVSPWVNSRMDDASTSSAIRSVGLNGVQLMMRQLASVTENYAQSSVDPSSWNFWPGHRAASSSLHQPYLHRNINELRFRSTSPPPNLLVMVERVREVLPHMPDELIIQDLLRTNNTNITVNNLLMMQ